MPTAKETFESSIKDASDLLDLFDKINTKPPPPNAEVLKRAGLIMACTAWETYVEDRLREAVRVRLGIDQVGFSGQYVLRNLAKELNQFNNPNSEKTLRVFKDFLGIDVSLGWAWNNYDPDRVKTELNALMKKRGDAVHRSKPAVNGDPQPHLIKRNELEKAIRFLRCLVDATDVATQSQITT
ncbi:HEPN domain-containing protein [Caenimonas sp. SL110]|uniref:HEPN domain-containing protein n=1 Tax=Caenimonas sp. SL110 TaxID=1450524 RepID=UPI0006534FAF|nr:HEPN domain-containing protein [Caenimonas sp. SL110]